MECKRLDRLATEILSKLISETPQLEGIFLVVRHEFT